MSDSRKKKYICGTCGQNYSSHSSLYRHRAHFHKMKYPIKSEYSSSKIKTEIDSEISSSTGLPRCRICNELFIRRRCGGPETINICDFCTKSLINVGALETQKEKVREKRHACELCPKKYRSKSELATHVAGHKKERAYTCEECGKAFSDKKCFDTHKRMHLGLKPFNCSLCNKPFANARSLRQHFLLHVEEVASETKIKIEPQ